MNVASLSFLSEFLDKLLNAVWTVCVPLLAGERFCTHQIRYVHTLLVHKCFKIVKEYTVDVVYFRFLTPDITHVLVAVYVAVRRTLCSADSTSISHLCSS